MELLKTPNIPKNTLNRMDMYNLFDFKPNFANFERIMTYDKDVRAINKRFFNGELTFDEAKALVVAHIKYYYDINYEKRYNKLLCYYITRKNKYFKL